VLRAPGIIAEDRLPIERLKQRAPALRADDDVWVNHIHAEDLARLAWLSLFRGRPGRVFNAVNNSRLKMADYFDLIAKTKGLPLPVRVSREELRTEIKKGTVSPMMASFMRDSRQVVSQRLTTELRATLRHPTTEEVIHRNRTPITPQ
jgi:nucleoside-diphosphate-sugar epimerase